MLQRVTATYFSEFLINLDTLIMTHYILTAQAAVNLLKLVLSVESLTVKWPEGRLILNRL